MPDVMSALKGIKAAQTKMDDAKGIVRESDKEIGENVKILIDACMPHCVKAAEKYNSTVSLKIVLNEIRLAFNLVDNTIVMKVHLCDPHGYEPDEELEIKDIDEMRNALSKILNAKLHRANVPFTLGKVSIPAHYFGK